MVLDKKSLRLLGLTANEIKVLEAIHGGLTTPLVISAHTGVSRPAVYEIITRLHKRRLIKSNIVSGKKYWSKISDRELEKELYNAKKQLLGIAGGVEEVFGVSDSTIVVHRGGEAVQATLDTLVKEHSSQRIYMLSGSNDQMVSGWDTYYGKNKINDFNRAIKQNQIISELVLSRDWFEKQIKKFGISWVKELEGRAAVAHLIDSGYLCSAGQLFIFKHSVYFLSMNEAMIIEVKNSEIQKLILSLFTFIQDNAKKIDLNSELRKLASEAEKSTSTFSKKEAPVLDQEPFDRFDSNIKVHQGASSIKELLRDLMANNQSETLYGIQGDLSAIGWNQVFGETNTQELNQLIKKNKISVEAILPGGWIERQVKEFGIDWAESFAGRKAKNTHEIDKAYFHHGGQVFIFKHSVYLISMSEEIIIEVRNSEIQKLLLDIFRFIQDHSQTIDLEARLQELI